VPFRSSTESLIDLDAKEELTDTIKEIVIIFLFIKKKLTNITN
jgi:hypothetical protein